MLIAAAALAAMLLAAAFSRRTGVATPLLLVLVGVAGSFLPGVPHPQVDPEVVLAGVLPPLLYATSVRLPVIDLRRNMRMIAWLSVVLVVLSAVVTGIVVHLVFPQVPLALGVALGAVVSPTDAVAATAIGRRLGLPHRLMTVLEGESLVNDASALVTLRTAVAATAGAFHLWTAVGDFALAVVMAVLVGLVGGWITVRVRSLVDDPVLHSAISFVVPFLVYFPAEELRASGVLAVVVAGLVTGTMGARRFSARERQTEATNWATLSFLLENGLFLLMGLQLPGLIESLGEESSTRLVLEVTALVLVLAVVLRAVGVLVPRLVDRTARNRRSREQLQQVQERLDTVEPRNDREQTRLAWMQRRVARGAADLDFEESQPITRRGTVVLGWAGMRGAVTIAAAQTIPADLPMRSTVVLVAFLVAVTTLLGFGGTLPWVIRRMDLSDASPQERREETTALLRSLFDTAAERLGPIGEQQVDGEPVDPQAVERVVTHLAPVLSGKAQEHAEARPDVRAQMLVLQRRYLEAMRDALAEERAVGAYRTETFTAVQHLLDQQETRLDGGA